MVKIYYYIICARILYIHARGPVIILVNNFFQFIFENIFSLKIIKTQKSSFLKNLNYYFCIT